MNKDNYRIVSSLEKYFEDKEEFGTMLKVVLLEDELNEKINKIISPRLLVDVQSLAVVAQNEIQKMFEDVDLDTDEDEFFVKLFLIMYTIVRDTRNLESYKALENRFRTVYEELEVDMDVYYKSVDTMLTLLEDKNIVKIVMETIK